MGRKFLELLTTRSVRAAQMRFYGRTHPVAADGATEPLTQDEVDFIQARDSFYMATVSESGWPYLQHRGGKPGFLRVLNPTELAFADFGGNRQLISTGNLTANDRTALFLMDYRRRERLKILGHTSIWTLSEAPDPLRNALGQAVEDAERIFRIKVVSFDWNCSKFITPRYTWEEFAALDASISR